MRRTYRASVVSLLPCLLWMAALWTAFVFANPAHAATELAVGTSEIQLRTDVGAARLLFGLSLAGSARTGDSEVTEVAVTPTIGLRGDLARHADYSSYLSATFGKRFVVATNQDDRFRDSHEPLYFSLKPGVSRTLGDRFSIEGDFGLAITYVRYLSPLYFDPNTQTFREETIKQATFGSSGRMALAVRL
ncbi:MAG: hypothetical protein R3E12_14480 [Candidatus Eisenbacteria bacterium]